MFNQAWTPVPPKQRGRGAIVPALAHVARRRGKDATHPARMTTRPRCERARTPPEACVNVCCCCSTLPALALACVWACRRRCAGGYNCPSLTVSITGCPWKSRPPLPPVLVLLDARDALGGATRAGPSTAKPAAHSSAPAADGPPPSRWPAAPAAAGGPPRVWPPGAREAPPPVLRRATGMRSAIERDVCVVATP